MKVRFVGTKKQDSATLRRRVLQANRTRNYRKRQKARKEATTINHQGELLSDAVDSVAENEALGPEGDSSLDNEEIEEDGISACENFTISIQEVDGSTISTTEPDPYYEEEIVDNFPAEEDERQRQPQSPQMHAEESADLATKDANTDVEYTTKKFIQPAGQGTPPEFELRKNIRALKEENLKLKAQLFSQSNQISDLRSEVDDYRHCFRAPEAEGAFLREQISALKSKLNAQEHLERDLQALEADSLAFYSPKMECELLYNKIMQVCLSIYFISDDKTLPEQSPAFHASLQNWARRISGKDLGGLITYSKAVKIEKDKLIAALLSGAVFELALKPDIAEIVGSEPPILAEYRKHILAQCGWQRLQQFDLVSIKSLVSKKRFKDEVVSTKAKELGLLVLQTLDCFLPLESRDIGQRLQFTENEVQVITSLEFMFSHALRMKTQLMLSSQQFRVLFYEPDVSFDAAYMQVGSFEGGESMTSPCKIKLCLVPALFRLSEDSNYQGCEDPTARFSTNYNECITEATPDSVGSLTLLSKAMVLL
ncbi:hypothetical protein F53441_11423 [Fusarium austroafricanum]|uniref:Uncharacterized protein n=1 Tax=Fusarium austroafricanum TaxID=2364996 RepID=A0A8H4NM76_9HYPO|nr:hypothetical protein F53441_11423 [Fusarium austroafricanum]